MAYGGNSWVAKQIGVFWASNGAYKLWKIQCDVSTCIELDLHNVLEIVYIASIIISVTSDAIFCPEAILDVP